MARKKIYQWDTDTQDTDAIKPSRSQKKRDSTALQELGDMLIDLPLARAVTMPITPDLEEALRLMARITNKEGRRRQRQYIGKLMRECDAEPIREALAYIHQGHSVDTARFHHVERLRTALLTADATEEAHLLQSWPHATEELHALLVQARQEENPHAKRALFRKLMALQNTLSDKTE